MPDPLILVHDLTSINPKLMLSYLSYLLLRANVFIELKRKQVKMNVFD